MSSPATTFEELGAAGFARLLAHYFRPLLDECPACGRSSEECDHWRVVRAAAPLDRDAIDAVRAAMVDA